MAAGWTVLLLAALVPAGALAQSIPVIETIAGGGPNNVPATNLSIAPYSAVSNGAGDLYVAATNLNRVYRRHPSGLMTLVAGTGVQANTGDGGRATRAGVPLPTGLALDAGGNLYIASGHIRRVEAVTGVITTVSGGGSSSADGIPASQASQGFGAHAIVLDTQGNLYISFQYNHKVRRIDAATGIITTVAGTGTPGYGGDGGPATAALLDSPHGIAVDTAGNLYISDTGNRRVRMVAAGSGVIRTVAGNGLRGWSGEGGPATSASLIYAAGLAADTAGNLYIGDYNDQDADGAWYNRVWKVDAVTGIISVYAGAATSCCDLGDGGPALGAVLHYPEGLQVDPAGDLIIASWAPLGRVRRVDAATGIITTLAGGSGTNGDGGPAEDAILDGQSGLARDAAGNLYLGTPGVHTVRRVDAATGVITTYAGSGDYGFAGDHGPAASAWFRQPLGLAVDAGGNLFIADRRNHRVRRVDAATARIDTYAGDGTAAFGGDGQRATQASLWFPAGVAVEPSGDLLIADTYNNRIRRVSAANDRINTVTGSGAYGFGGDGGTATAASLAKPTALAVDALGNIIIADTENHRVRRVDAATGLIDTVAGNGTAGFGGDGAPATSASLHFPSGVSVEPDGSIVIVDSSNQRIRRVDAATGLISTVAGTGTAGFSGDGEAATGATVWLSREHGGIVSTGAEAFLFGGSGRIRSVEPAAPAPAGRVPDGEDPPGDPLTIVPAPYGMIELSWGASCAASGTDYALYQGTLGTFTAYSPRFCSTGGATTLTFPPDPADRFYLVVPRSILREGSYGSASDGSERAPSASACLPQEIGTCPQAPAP